MGRIRALALALPLLLAGTALAAQELERAFELHREGRLEEALAAYRRLLATAPAETEAAAARNAACAALNDLGRFAQALAECDRAEEMRRRIAPGPELADTLNNRALALDSLGRPREAETAYEEALSIYRAAGSAEDQAFVLSNLASLAIGRGDFGAALERLDAAERLAQEAGGEPWADEELRVARINRAVTLERLGAYREALAELRAAPPGEGAAVEEAALREVNIAVLYRNLGDPWRALAHLDEAERRLGRHPDPSLRATIELNRGLVALHGLGDPARARVAFARALEGARASGDRKEEGRALVALGRAALALADPEAAENAFRQALDTTDQTESAETRWTALGGLARAALSAGDRDRARMLFTESMRTIEAAGSGLSSGALREGLIEDQREIFGGLIDLLAERALRGEPDAALEALGVTERARARELLAAVSDESEVSVLEGAALADAAHRFAPALVYFAGLERLWRFRLERSGAVRVEDAGAVRDTLQRSLSLHEALAASRRPDRSELDRLAERLLPDDLDSSELLRVVPDSVLHYLPFEVLPGADGRALGETTAIAYAPSLSTLARLDSIERPEPRWKLLAWADPAPGEGRSAAGSTADLLAARFGLAPLPFARAEAERAASRIGPPSLVRIGSEATESAFRRRSAEGAGVVLIAAHTLVDERIEGGVAIFLAPGEGEDGALTATELARTPLSADLVILSGCRTALAGRRAGRSMATLSGAMLGAGARGVVATLWEVDDEDARAVMDGFFWHLARGVAPAEALRRAKQRIANDPQWARRLDAQAFVLLGDPAALETRPGGFVTVAAAALLLALAAALALWSRRAT